MNDKLLTFETEYAINYNTKDPVPIPEVIESLRSIERLIHRTPAFIEKAYQGVYIVEVQVFVASIQTGSLKEKFIVRYIFRGQENYDRAKEVITTMLDDSGTMRTLVAVGVSALATYGIMQSLSPSAPSKHIEAYNNTIINIGGQTTLKTDDITSILNAITDKKSLAKEAIGAIRPAKIDPNSTIEIEGVQGLLINKEFIRETPDEYTAPIPEEKTAKYTNVDIVTFASDRDRTESGWAGIAPNIVDTRVKLILGENIDPAKLYGQTRFKADIVVTERFNKLKKRYEPKSIEILKTNK